MEVGRWIEADESAEEMLSRALTERPPFFLLPPLHRFPLHVGNVLEIVGPSASAKTLILIQAAISCILPKEWNGVQYGGLGRSVMYIDLDCRFDVSCLAEFLKHRIMEANGQQRNGDLQNHEVKRQHGIGYDEELFAECMNRFFYVRGYNSSEFLAILKTLHYQLKVEKEAHGMCVHFLMIDRRPGHFKATCWKLHGKPIDWKPSGSRQDRNTRAYAATSDQTPQADPFTPEQVETLQKLINQAAVSKPAPETVEQHTSLMAHQGSGYGEGDWQC